MARTNSSDLPLPKGSDAGKLLSGVDMRYFRLSSDNIWVDLEYAANGWEDMDDFDANLFHIKIPGIKVGAKDNPLKNVLWQSQDSGKKKLIKILRGKKVLSYLIGEAWYLRIMG